MRVLTKFYNNTDTTFPSKIANIVLFPLDVFFGQTVHVSESNIRDLKRYQFTVIPFATTTTSYILKAAAVAAGIVVIGAASVFLGTAVAWWVPISYAPGLLTIGIASRLTSWHSKMDEHYQISKQVDEILQSNELQLNSILLSPHLNHAYFLQEIILRASAKHIDTLPQKFFDHIPFKLQKTLLFAIRKEIKINKNNSSLLKENEEKLKSYILKIKMDQLTLKPKEIFKLITYLDSPKTSELRTVLANQFRSISQEDLNTCLYAAHTPMQKVLLVNFFNTSTGKLISEKVAKGVFLKKILSKKSCSKNAEFVSSCKRAGIDLNLFFENCLKIGVSSNLIDQVFIEEEKRPYLPTDRLIEILQHYQTNGTSQNFIYDPKYFYFIAQRLIKDPVLFIEGLLQLDSQIKRDGLFHSIIKQSLICLSQEDKDSTQNEQLALQTLFAEISKNQANINRLITVFDECELISLLAFFETKDQFRPFCSAIKAQLNKLFKIFLDTKFNSSFVYENEYFQKILVKSTENLSFQIYMISLIGTEKIFKTNEKALLYASILFSLWNDNICDVINNCLSIGLHPKKFINICKTLKMSDLVVTWLRKEVNSLAHEENTNDAGSLV